MKKLDELMTKFPAIPFPILFFGIYGFYNNMACIIADKLENFDEWNYYKISTIICYGIASIITEIHHNKK